MNIDNPRLHSTIVEIAPDDDTQMILHMHWRATATDGSIRDVAIDAGPFSPTEDVVNWNDMYTTAVSALDTMGFTIVGDPVPPFPG